MSDEAEPNNGIVGEFGLNDNADGPRRPTTEGSEYYDQQCAIPWEPEQQIVFGATRQHHLIGCASGSIPHDLDQQDGFAFRAKPRGQQLACFTSASICEVDQVQVDLAFGTTPWEQQQPNCHGEQAPTPVQLNLAHYEGPAPSCPAHGIFENAAEYNSHIVQMATFPVAQEQRMTEFSISDLPMLSLSGSYEKQIFQLGLDVQAETSCFNEHQMAEITQDDKPSFVSWCSLGQLSTNVCRNAGSTSMFTNSKRLR